MTEYMYSQYMGQTEHTEHTENSHVELAHTCYVVHRNTKLIELRLDLCSVLLLYFTRQFDELPDAREKLRKEIGLKWVDGIPGVRVQCGNIPCVFEFVTYKYKSHSDNYLQPTNTSSMPLEEPDVGVAFSQPKNDDETAGSGDWTEAPLDLTHPDTRRFIEVMGKLPRPLSSRQQGTRPPTRFIPLNDGSPPSLRQPSTSPPITTVETMPTMQTMPTTDSKLITEGEHPSMRDSTSSDPESSQTLPDQLPNNDVVALQLDTDASRPKPKSPVQRDDLSPTNSLGPALSAQSYASSGTPPLRMRRKPDKNLPVTPQGTTQPSNARNYSSNDRESRSQMSLDVDDLLELLPTRARGDDSSSILHNNDAAAALTAVNEHTVDNKALDASTEGGSTEV